LVTVEVTNDPDGQRAMAKGIFEAIEKTLQLGVPDCQPTN
jgi:hypothetical protein